MTPSVNQEGNTGYTKEQYDRMQEKAHELGLHLITPYRKGLKNIRVGIIVNPTPKEDVKE